jgi:hypothetical protein
MRSTVVPEAPATGGRCRGGEPVGDRRAGGAIAGRCLLVWAPVGAGHVALHCAIAWASDRWGEDVHPGDRMLVYSV